LKALFEHHLIVDLELKTALLLLELELDENLDMKQYQENDIFFAQ